LARSRTKLLPDGHLDDVPFEDKLTTHGLAFGLCTRRNIARSGSSFENDTSGGGVSNARRIRLLDWASSPTFGRGKVLLQQRLPKERYREITPMRDSSLN
jgi:hypothetical protein